MKIGIIGRSELMFNTAKILIDNDYEIPFIITATEAPEYKKNAEDFKKLAKKINSGYLCTSKINNEITHKFLNKYQDVSLCLSVNYSGVISSEIINKFKIGILNAHGGDLPKYRGNACQAWAILNNEKKIGLCIHKMIGGELDSGDIIKRAYLDIDITTKIGECYKWMEDTIPKLFLNAVKELECNENYLLEVQSKDPSHALRCYPRQPSDGKIDFSSDAEDIIRLVNASGDPFYGAFCYFKNKELKIYDAEIYNDNEKFVAVSGQVIKVDRSCDFVVIAANGKKIILKEIEFEGKRSKPASILNSIRIRLT